jgi:hypothetical protein
MSLLPAKDKRLNFWEWPAYLIDIYRLFPRAIFLVATFAMFKMGLWYMYVLIPLERTAEVSAFVAVCVGAWTKLMDYYMQRGVDWGRRMQINGGEAHADTGSSTTVS